MTRLPDAAAGTGDAGGRAPAGTSTSAPGPTTPPGPTPSEPTPPESTPPEPTPPESTPPEPVADTVPVPVVEEPPRPVAPARGPSEVALGAVLLVVLVGLALVGQDHWRRGLLLAGIGLLGGAVARLVLPPRLAGLLAVRGRIFDAIVLGGLGVAVIVLTTSVPVPAGG